METSVYRNPESVLIRIKFNQNELIIDEKEVDLYITNNVSIKDGVVFKKLLYDLIDQIEFPAIGNNNGTAGEG